MAASAFCNAVLRLSAFAGLVLCSLQTVVAQPAPASEPPAAAPNEGTTPSPSAVVPPSDTPVSAAPDLQEPVSEPSSVNESDSANEPDQKRQAEVVDDSADLSGTAQSDSASEVTDTEDTDALLARLDAQLSENDVTGVAAPTLSLYGFSDLSFHKYFIHPGSPLRANLYTKSAFAVGNLNLYLAGDLGSGWSSLAEIRFTYLPNGTRTFTAEGVQRTNTLVQDSTNLGYLRRTGSIFIERAWLEYAADPLLVIRAGNWLTPYGIWIDDHGSPTIIGVRRPYVIGQELLPERQTGVQLRGTTYPSDRWTLGYALALSNGRGPVHEYADLDENKATTLRLWGTHRGAGTLQLGMSAFYGRFTDSEQTLAASGDTVRINDSVVEQYDELSLALDFKYTLGGFHSQIELIASERAFTEGGRRTRTDTTFTPDHHQFGGYLVTGYRFDWLGMMPYLQTEYFRFPNTLDPGLPESQLALSVTALGLNARPTHNVTLKLEGSIGYFLADLPRGSPFKYPLAGLQTQAAYAF